QGDVDLVLFTRRLLHPHIVIAFERFEVAELIDAADAVLQPFGIEDAGFVDAQVATDDRIAGRRVADDRNAVDEVLRAFLDADDDVGLGHAGRQGLLVRPTTGGRRVWADGRRRPQPCQSPGSR